MVFGVTRHSSNWTWIDSFSNIMPSEYPKKSDLTSIYQYEVDLILGQGGTGTVYRGRDPESGQIVAIKLLRANFIRNRSHERDLSKTVKKFKKLSHPNVAQIFDFLTGKEGICIVLEYVDGPDLKWYTGNRAWNLQERLVVTAQICNGLGFIHESGCMHHDLKPANVLFTRKGQVKLCDFSLASGGGLLSIFEGGLVEQVTPMYVAPEIIRKKKATKLSDMYSFGVLLYLLFTEKVPYEVDNLQRLYMAHLQSTPLHPNMVNPKCPVPLGDIIMRLMDHDPKKRFPNCDELRIALSDIGRSRI